MKKAYPNSIPCSFMGHPLSLEVICGPYIHLPFSYGSKVRLFRTPTFDEPQGAYVEDEDLPDHFLSYSDTGLDDTFDLKLSYYAWGTFYIAESEDTYCKFEVRKGVQVESMSKSRRFEVYNIWDTRIPSSEVLTSNLEEYQRLIRSGKIPKSTPAKAGAHSFTIWKSIEGGSASGFYLTGYDSRFKSVMGFTFYTDSKASVTI